MVLFYVYNLLYKWQICDIEAEKYNTNEQKYQKELMEHWVWRPMGRVLLIWSGCILVFDKLDLLWWIICFIKKHCSRKLILRKKHCMVDSMIYRLCQYIICFFIFRGEVFKYDHYVPIIYRVDIAFVFMATPHVILYFVQLLPQVGYFVTVLNRMTNDMLNFILVFIIFTVPSACGFRLFFTMFEVCDMFRGPTYTFVTLFYDVFLIMLNMKDMGTAVQGLPSSYDKDSQIVFESFVMIMHIIYVFWVTILLLNFLIAMFSNTVNVLSCNKHMISMIQRLSVALTVESRLGFIFQWIYRYRQKKYLVHKDQQIYIIETVYNNNTGSISHKMD